MWYEDEVVDTVCSARTACGSWRTGPGYATHVIKHRRNEWVLVHPSTRCLSMTLMSLLRCKEKPNSTADMEVICNPTVDGYCTLLRHILLWLYTCTSIWNMGVLINLKRSIFNICLKNTSFIKEFLNKKYLNSIIKVLTKKLKDGQWINSLAIGYNKLCSIYIYDMMLTTTFVIILY